MKLPARMRSDARWLWIIPVMVSVTSVFAQRTLVDIIVAQHVRSELQPKLDRLATDLRNEGYTARITTWPAGKSGRDVWNHLKDGYDKDNLQGAILVGHVPTTTEGNDKNITDIPYWCMSSYSSMSPKHIWVSRFYGPIEGEFYGEKLNHDYGDEIRFLENALKANHEYRTGKTRLPHKAFTHTCIRREGQNKACKGHQLGVGWATAAREVWPESEALYAEELDDAMFEWGGDLLDEFSHGWYWKYGEKNITRNKVFAQGCRIRTILASSCTVAGFGDVLNVQNICDNTYNVITVGTSGFDFVDTKGETDHTIMDNDGSAFRRQLKAGKAWGLAMLAAYPFENDERTIMYGDLSVRPTMFPPGEPAPEYTITVVAKLGGAISPARPVRVRRGNNETFTITPAGLFFIDDVLIDGKSEGAVARYTFENVQSDHTIEAVFASNSATIVSDDFESGDVYGGAGSWTAHWSNNVSVSNDAAHGGAYSLKLDCGEGNASTSTRHFSTVGGHANPITLEFEYMSEDFKAEERLQVYVYNRKWHKLDELHGTNGVFRRFEYDLTPHWKGDEFDYRIWFLISDCSSGIVYIDDFKIYGAGGSSNTPPGISSNPRPVHEAVDVDETETLSWTPGSGAISHIVYFGTDATPDNNEKQGTQTATVFDPGPLEKATTYYWRIDEVNEYGTTKGDVWSFTTVDDAVNLTELSRKHSLPRIISVNGNIFLHTGSRTGIHATLTIADPRGRIVWKQSFEHARTDDIISFPPHIHGAFFVTLRAGTTRLQKRVTVIE